MEEPEKIFSILIVEDDIDVADMLNAYFRVQSYKVNTVHWGEDCIRACRASLPDLIILDIRLPDIDGYTVAQRLRSNHRTEQIPIIFLTEKRKRDDRLKGLGLGADDYITKPFDIQELRLRVRNALRRSSQGALNNPITGLPEGVLVDERLMECLETQADWAIMPISLVNLESFREAYGFVASDDVLRAVSLMIHNAMRDQGAVDDFVGHLSTTRFILVTQLEHVADLKERIQSRLEQSLEYFYPLKDRESGTPKGPRLSIFIGESIHNQDKPFEDLSALKSMLLSQPH